MKNLVLSVLLAAGVMSPLLATAQGTANGSVPITLQIDSWVSLTLPPSVTVEVSSLSLAGGVYFGQGEAESNFTIASNCPTGGTIVASAMPTIRNAPGVTWSAGVNGASGPNSYPFGFSTTNQLFVGAEHVSLADAAGSYPGAAVVTVTVTNAT